MTNKLAAWKKEFALRKQYGQPSRKPFFKLAGKFLPENNNAIVVDVGAGDGSFARELKLGERYHSLFLLDHTQSSVDALKKEFPNTLRYNAPEKLPFENNSVSFIHLSHIVEHLLYQDLYTFIKECDRVLTTNGVLIVSTPLLWDRFYDDMSHIKPYNPTVFINYLCSGRDNASAEIIATNYTVDELVYRYRAIDDQSFGSKYFLIDLLIRIVRIASNALGFRHYVKNGYTLVLRKN